MNDRLPEDRLPEDRLPEDRLRRALASRAERVEPRRYDLAEVEARAGARRAADRRRRGVLSIAAVVLVLAGIVGGIWIAGDDDDGTRLATDGGADPATVAPGPPTAIWPLPTMSIVYDDPVDAALAFADAYLGLRGAHPCPRTPEVVAGTARVAIVHDGVCGGVTSGAEPFGPTTTVTLVQTGSTWAVTGATSNMFTATFGPGELDPPPTEGLPVPVAAFVTPVVDLERPLSVELRPLGTLESTGSGSMPRGAAGDRVQIPMGVAFEGRRVLVVTDGVTGVATLVGADVRD